MKQEIERKFAVSADWKAPEDAPAVIIRQAYLTPVEADTEIRVRAAGRERVMTVKAKRLGGDPMVRAEVEFALGEEIFDQLWALADGAAASVSKVRRRVPIGARSAEVDEYEGPLLGLRVVEVEFDTREEAGAFSPPAWFGEELTGVAGWGNRSLAEANRRARTGAGAKSEQPDQMTGDGGKGA